MLLEDQYVLVRTVEERDNLLMRAKSLGYTWANGCDFTPPVNEPFLLHFNKDKTLTWTKDFTHYKQYDEFMEETEPRWRVTGMISLGSTEERVIMESTEGLFLNIEKPLCLQDAVIDEIVKLLNEKF